MKLARYLIAYAVLAVVGVTAGWLASRSDNAPPSVVGGRASSLPIDGQSASFTIHGSVDNLTLAHPTTLNLSVTNPNPWPITIHTLTVVPADASSTCPAAGNIRIDSYDSSTPGARRYQVASHQMVTVGLQVVVINESARSQDTCKNVRFQLRYNGTATAGG